MEILWNCLTIIFAHHKLLRCIVDRLCQMSNLVRSGVSRVKFEGVKLVSVEVKTTFSCDTLPVFSIANRYTTISPSEYKPSLSLSSKWSTINVASILGSGVMTITVGSCVVVVLSVGSSLTSSTISPDPTAFTRTYLISPHHQWFAE